jgi:hypothetical protein
MAKANPMCITYLGRLYFVTTPASLSALLLQLRCRRQFWG